MTSGYIWNLMFTNHFDSLSVISLTLIQYIYRMDSADHLLYFWDGSSIKWIKIKGLVEEIGV